MGQTVLIYATRRQRSKLIKRGITILAEYEDYVLARVTSEQVVELRQAGLEIETYRTEAKPVPLALTDDRPTPGPHPADLGPGHHYYLLEFVGPIKPEWLQEIEAHGGQLQDPEPPTGYIVALDPPAYEWLVQDAEFLHTIVHYGVEKRLSPGLLDTIQDDPRLARGAVREVPDDFRPPPHVERVPTTFSVRFFQPADLQAALPRIRDLGATPSEPPPEAKVITVTFAPGVEDLGARLEQLAALHGVRSVEPYILRQLRNDVAAGLMGAQEVMDPSGLGLSGRGEIVGVADSGLDTGDPQTIHPDFAGRIVAIHSWPITSDWAGVVTQVGVDDGPADARSGHGTHVAGSILGSASVALATAGAAVRGLAHEARLVFQAVEQQMQWTEEYRQNYFRQYGRWPPEYGLAGLPADLNLLFGQAYDLGARIHNNSWGGGIFGAYDDYAEAVDRFMWEHKDFLILFAAGNDGVDANRDGWVDAGSITPPGTAKNSVTVGAAESVRAAGGHQTTYGQFLPGSFPVNPLRDDLISDHPDDIAAFSSRGPTRDGRIKPDVVAPGTNVLSTRSALLPPQTGGWGVWAASERYMFNGGTSMATPLAAGAAALLRQYLRVVKRRVRPSAALVKATLIHGARLRRDRHAPPADGPFDYAQGWGHVHLDSLFGAARPVVRWYDQQRGLHTGQSWKWTCNVQDTALPLELTLAWTDYPGSPGVYPNLVNDLDLVVTTPSGDLIYGNARPGQPPAPDRVNNVERIIIPAPEPGRYRVRVRAFNVPFGPQDFALVYSGGLA